MVGQMKSQLPSEFPESEYGERWVSVRGSLC